MGKRILSRALVGATLLTAPITAGFAQMGWVPGSEITGHSVQAETNGVMNTIYFDPGGVARIQSPGGDIVPGTWSVSGNNLCLTAGGAQECWSYSQPFQSGTPVMMTSSCGTSRWTALSTAMPSMPPPPPQGSGERG